MKMYITSQLSGGYGIGKSSILRQFASLLKGRCIEVSLSTLAPVNRRNPENEAVTSGDTTTNKIQREVVKQLLYRESAQNALVAVSTNRSIFSGMGVANKLRNRSHQSR